MNTALDASSTLDVHCLLGIVDGIYAAACGEATWDQALARVCQFGRFEGSALSAVDARERQCAVLAACGLAPRARHDRPVAGDSPLVDSILRSRPGDVWHDREILSDVTPAGASRPAAGGVASSARVVVGREERQIVCLEVYGGAGREPGCPEPGAFLRQLAPHLVRAWRIGRASRAALARSVPAASRAQSRAEVGPAGDLAGLPEAARLRAQFGLTRAEARLALRLVEGSTLAGAAEAFDVKLTTIRSQLQQVFAKTGTCRQSELVATLLRCGYGPRGLHWGPARSTPAEATLAG